ncbi:MAG TPA: transcriptional regulator NrdR [Phycisphaerales bacterium]|nr:transcriptional regulator NrdR [Phycisphaerales bacterium]
MVERDIPLRCPFCEVDNDRVIDSRASEAGAVIRRRRECLGCKKRFTTYERVERTARLAVVKRDGRREAFDSLKILAGIQHACGKRPVSEEAKSRIVQDIDEELHRDFDREVSSQEIGKRVAIKLRQLDPIVYLRFASEYDNFNSLEDFDTAMSDLRHRRRELPNQTDLFNDVASTAKPEA